MRTTEVSSFDILPIAVYCTDQQGKLTYYNKAAEDLFAQKPQIDDTDWLTLGKMFTITGKALNVQDTPMYQVQTGQIANLKQEIIVEQPGGKYINILIHSVAAFDAEGNFTGATHTLIDITDQKGSEAKQAMLAAIIESSEDAIISKSLQGVITSWNSAAQRLFGYHETEAIGKHITMLIPDDRLQEETEIIRKVTKGEIVEHFETIRRRKDGVHFPISVTVSPIKDSMGRVIGASKIARNIARQKEAEAQLKQYARHLEILNSVSKAVSENMDVQGILQKVTDATTELTGASFGAFFYNVVNQSGEAYMLYTLSGAPKEAFEKFGMPRNTAVFQPTFEGQGIVRVDDITKDPRYGKNHPHGGMPKGHLPVVSYLAIPVMSKSGQVIGGLLYGHPEPARFTQEHEKLVEGIAAHAAVALDNAKLYEQIQQLNAKKDEFIGLASHELKTPVTSISAYLQIIERNPVNWERNQNFITKARQQMNKLSDLISDLLDVSKIETGKLPLKFSTFNITELLNEVVELTQHSNPSHQIIVHAPDETIPIYADRLRIEQVIINLITNAVRYSPGTNQIIVRLATTPTSVRLAVQDFGIGIDQAHLQQIFTRFYRVDDLAAHMSGLGIGLYISYEIIARHQGTLTVESEVGTGSTFTFEIPFTQSKHA